MLLRMNGEFVAGRKRNSTNRTGVTTIIEILFHDFHTFTVARESSTKLLRVPKCWRHFFRAGCLWGFVPFQRLQVLKSLTTFATGEHFSATNTWSGDLLTVVAQIKDRKQERGVPDFEVWQVWGGVIGKKIREEGSAPRFWQDRASIHLWIFDLFLLDFTEEQRQPSNQSKVG